MELMLSYLLLAVAAVTAASARLGLVVDMKTGSYKIQMDGVDWLFSSAYGVRYNGQLLSSTNGMLTLKSARTGHGNDTLGDFNSTVLTWNYDGIDIMETLFIEYRARDLIVFWQAFPIGLTGCSLGDNRDVITAFPTFNRSLTEPGLLNFLTYRGSQCPGSLNSWSTAEFGDGFEYGPITLYDKALSAMTISAMSNFMTAIPVESKSLGGAIAFGFNGKVESLIERYTHATMLQGGQGIKSTMSEWGKILLSQGGKTPATPHSDPSISHLGYYTDNGAYYYYKTEPKKNYQQTMLDVKAAAMKLGIPFKYFQFDSWWYYKDSNGAVTLWEPRPDVFPDGMTQWLDMPLVLHNRWWSPHSNYSHDWFVAEQDCALPTSEDLFTYIMTKAKKWGMIVYEQDWLVTTYSKMNVTQDNIFSSRRWLTMMGDAAAKLNLTVQYCMALPLHILESTEIQAVTHARASHDYRPGNTNWNIGLTSLFYSSVGLIPFKDDFFTFDGDEEDCPYHSNCTEPNNVLETLIATLSCGPVGPSDGIEYLNMELIMRTCRSDGLLLKPDRPAVFHDAAFRLGFDTQDRNEIWHTAANMSGTAVHYVLAMDLDKQAELSLSDLGEPASARFMAFNYFDSCPLGSEQCAFTVFNEVNTSQPLELKSTKQTSNPGAGAVTFQYWVLAPVWPNGWVPLGEGSKFVPLSQQRITSMSADEGKPFKFTAVGAAGEKVTLYALFLGGDVGSISNTIPASGKISVQCTGQDISDVKCSQDAGDSPVHVSIVPPRL